MDAFNAKKIMFILKQAVALTLVCSTTVLRSGARTTPMRSFVCAFSTAHRMHIPREQLERMSRQCRIKSLGI